MSSCCSVLDAALPEVAKTLKHCFFEDLPVAICGWLGVRREVD